MRPPAFQFYADDFLSGTADMTAEEVGVYIRLLCHAWTKDGLDDNDSRLAMMAGQCQASSLAYAKSKFGIKDGRLRNDRQEAEREKQRLFREKQAQNGRKTWLGIAKPDAKPLPSLMPNGCSPSPSPSPNRESDQQVEFPKSFPKSEQDAAAHAGFIGCTEDFAKQVWNEAAARGGKDFAGNAVLGFRQYLSGRWQKERGRQSERKTATTTKPKHPMHGVAV